MTASIFIYCDDPSHPRRVAVTRFDRINGRWHERSTSHPSHPNRTAGIGVPLVRDVVAEPGWANDDGIGSGEYREKLDLRCRRCRRRTVAARPENLYPVFDGLLDAGVSSVSLRLLAASLQRRSEAGSDPTRSGPGLTPG